MLTDSPAQERSPRADFGLRARGIRKSFGGTEVLHGIDVDVVGGRVLALLGENGAGKSTLVRVLAGAHAPDAGTLTFETGDGAVDTITTLDPVAARRRGVRMIFQELSDSPDLSVLENISLGQWPRRSGFVSWRAMRRTATEVLDELGVSLDLDAPVGSLRIGERQIIEIARALSERASCLILDEPTAALSGEEVERLFGFVDRLRRRGVALVYITHRLDEVARIADDVLVMRDGEVAAAGRVADFARRELVHAMVGRDLGSVQRPEQSTLGADAETLVQLRGAGSGAAFTGIDLQVRAGEIVCLYGKIGSGTTEVADAVFGRRRTTAGSVDVLGAEPPADPRAAIEAGIGYLAADRQREGLLRTLSVGENLAAPSWPRLSSRGLVSARLEHSTYARWQERLRIRTDAGPRQLIGTLSGGNQQKILLARWLERGSRVLALVEPTRGVDVGARVDIYAALRNLAASGAAVLISTSDYEEVIQLADRAVVMVQGRVTVRLAGPEITVQSLTDAAGG